MQTILVELKNNKAYEELHNLEARHLIRIVNEDTSSYTLNGKPTSTEDFKKWVEFAENTPTISLTQAKQQWETRKKKLL